MPQSFKEQGGAATMDPSWLRRWALSRVVTHRFSQHQIAKRRAQAEKRRVQTSQPHVVEYFHQVDDGYSHLAAQLLTRLAERYNIELRCHLVRGPAGKNVSDATQLLALSRYDSGLIASEYGLTFPSSSDAPDVQSIALAHAILAKFDEHELGQHLADVSTALWSGDVSVLNQLADVSGRASVDQVNVRLDAGTSRRTQLQHYSGAMFYYEGEWYWGVDRLHYLEERLSTLGLDTLAGHELIAPCPVVDVGDVSERSDLTLEFYPSLRSPYTSIVFDETVALARQTGVTFRIRPVLPMVMRGIPATREKGFYIFFDTAREAKRRGVPYGRFFDPIGQPVRRCYALYPWAVTQGKGTELLSSFLRHAFSLGVNTNTDRGLRQVVEDAGLNWNEATTHLTETDWQALLESNRLAMYNSGLWGVPSYRLFDASGTPLLEVWGQDRLWLVAREIRRRERH